MPDAPRIYGERPAWRPGRPRLRPLRMLLSLVASALGLLAAAAIVPGVVISGFGAALIVAGVVAVLNAVVPPILAALRLPFTLLAGFVLVLAADAAILLIASDVLDDFAVSGFWRALLVALLAAAVTMAIEIVAGINDDDRYTIQVTRRVARRQGAVPLTDVPGIVFLEIDGLALPVLARAVRDGNAPVMARWLTEGGYALAEWETDLSSQTGASQAGILLGSNDDVPAFRWVEKESRRTVACSDPADCAEMERRLGGSGLLRDGGASRGNLLSGEADESILTVSRLADEKGPNPGYRAFLANGSNIVRSLVLFSWEVVLELTAASRQRRRDVRPRGHRGGSYPLLRGAMCVMVRDLVVQAVLADMMAGRPAVYATFASYDEVAHHSGLERHDTLEALRKLDQQFGRIEQARRYAPRPYEIVVLSDHGQTQGATFRQRNGYSLDDLVRRSLSVTVAPLEAGEENDTLVGQALGEATGRDAARQGRKRIPDDEEVVVLASGNLGLVYLLERQGRMTLEEISERHPDLLPALRAHPHIGLVMVRSAADGPVVMGPEGVRRLEDGAVDGVDPLLPFPPGAAGHLRRTDGFANAPDILINSFFDPELEEGCAFEELISFHGGLGGPQTRPFVLYPASLPAPAEPLVGAAAVHELLAGWRRFLQG